MKTLITIVLDKSGSMSNLREETLSGLNHYLLEQKALPGECVVSLIEFDDKYEPQFMMKDIKDLPKIEYVPRGYTALLDAIGRCITDTGNALDNMQIAQKPDTVIFVIITDGFENSSKEYTYVRIKDMIQHQTTKYSWNFVYLGANQDAIAQGCNIGIQMNNSQNYSSTKQGMSHMYDSISFSTKRARCNVASGQSIGAFFDTTSADDKKEDNK